MNNITRQDIFDFYIEVLRECDIKDEIEKDGDLNNIFDEAFKGSFGSFPDDFFDDDDDDDDEYDDIF